MISEPGTVGLDAFPADPTVLFFAGVLHETRASPVHQSVVLPGEVKVSYGSEESELKLALQFFHKAVAADPNYAEAHLRLGRVMGLPGHHDQAADSALGRPTTARNRPGRGSKPSKPVSGEQGKASVTSGAFVPKIPWG
jgi:hypothetical protein